MGEYEATTKENTCVFCDIVAKNDPDIIFWEDENHVAFLAIDPNTLGFSLVVPKKHYNSDIVKMNDAAFSEFVLSAKKVANLLENFF